MAYCVAYPHVRFPAGAQGIVAPWFVLQGLNGFQLFRAMPGLADNDGAKSARGTIAIKCKKGQTETTCTIDY